MSSVFARRLKVSKTDAFELDVSAWANGETITITSVSHADSLVAVVSSAVSSGVISVLLTGVATGVAEVYFNYATPTRSDCFVGRVVVVEDCQ